MSENDKKTIINPEFDTRGFWIRLGRLLTPSHQQIIRLFFSTIALEIFRLVGPYILKVVIDTITNFTIRKVWLLIGLIVGMFLANQIVSFLNFLNDKKVFKILASVQSYLSNNAYRKMLFLGLEYHEKENTGNKITKIQKGVDKISDLLGNLAWEVAPTALQIIFTAIVLFVIDWRFGIIVIIFVPAFILITLRVNRKNYPLRIERHNAQEEAAGVMAQSIININTVKSFVQEKRENAQFLESLGSTTA